MFFTPINFVLHWAPLPWNRKRDHAQRTVAKIYMDTIKRRRAQGQTDAQDIMYHLMNSTYKDGTTVPDHEIAHMMIALLMAGESVRRFFAPVPIHFNQAIGVAVIGLLVNLVCALLLKGDDHHHHHGHSHADHGHHSDLNLRAAYVHVLADALTSVTAIIALTAGKYLGWSWLDPVMGIVGSVVVSVWAYGLVRDTSGILLDLTPESSDLPLEIRRAVEGDGDSLITDLHVWQLGAGRFAAIVSVVAHDPKPAETYRELFREHEELVHVTVEVQHCHEREDAHANA